jgi:hypothetical protein
MGKGLKVYLAALTQGMFTIKVADSKLVLSKLDSRAKGSYRCEYTGM